MQSYHQHVKQELEVADAVVSAGVSSTCTRQLLTGKNEEHNRLSLHTSVFAHIIQHTTGCSLGVCRLTESLTGQKKQIRNLWKETAEQIGPLAKNGFASNLRVERLIP